MELQEGTCVLWRVPVFSGGCLCSLPSWRVPVPCVLCKLGNAHPEVPSQQQSQWVSVPSLSRQVWAPSWGAQGSGQGGRAAQNVPLSWVALQELRYWCSHLSPACVTDLPLIQAFQHVMTLLKQSHWERTSSLPWNRLANHFRAERSFYIHEMALYYKPNLDNLFNSLSS